MAGKDVNEVGRLDEKKKKKREDLLNATYELFTSKGVFDTSISDIVKKANMAKGTFYLYFKDKYDIRKRRASFSQLHMRRCTGKSFLLWKQR